MAIHLAVEIVGGRAHDKEFTGGVELYEACRLAGVPGVPTYPCSSRIPRRLRRRRALFGLVEHLRVVDVRYRPPCIVLVALDEAPMHMLGRQLRAVAELPELAA